jgi:dihydroxy-acid dehydratase
VSEAGGTPREFTTITVTDGIGMGHQGMKSSLMSHDLIADSVELTVRGHCYDALVGLAGCDKSLPGMMMAMLRLNIPSVFMYGGSILPGKFKGRDVTVVDLFEAVGQHAAGTMSDEDLHELECVACPSAGACGGQFTADTMATAPDGAIVKVAGLHALRFEGTALCFDSEEEAYAAVNARAFKAGDVIIIRYKGPKGGPGMREMLSTTGASYGQGMGELTQSAIARG